jgi:hypothetical protein
MPYDELDRYYGGAQFVPRRAAVDPSIPTGHPSDSSSNKPSGALDMAGRVLKRAATDFNPLMYMRTLQDAPKMLFNASPINAALSLGAVPLNLIQNKGAELLHSAFGEEADAQAARDRNANPQPANFQLPMRSQSGQAAQDAIYKAIDESKIAGALGMPNIPSRGFNPNDLRVVAGNVGRVGKQVRELPTDFQNAQSGFKRIDSVTNEPVLGAKVQNVAEGVGDYMARREMQGLAPVPGLPAALQPDTKVYAVRPDKTTLVRAQAPAYSERPIERVPEVTQLDPVAKFVYGNSPTDLSQREGSDRASNTAVRDSYMERYLPADEQRVAFRNFADRKAMELFPDAPSLPAAREAVNAAFSKSSNARDLQLLNEFSQTPEAQQLASTHETPAPLSVPEFQERYAAADDWLKKKVPNYIYKNVGAEGDPSVRLAGEGIMLADPETLRYYSAEWRDLALKNRRAAGMPEQTATEAAMQVKGQELTEATNAWHAIPEGNEFTNARAAASAKVNSIQKQLTNLHSASMYETVADSSVSTMPAGEVAKMTPYPMQQFFPSIMRASPSDKAYVLAHNSLSTLGYDKLIKDFHEAVISGEIPTNKLEGLTVEKYIKQNGDLTALRQQQALAARQLFLDKTAAHFESLAQSAPPETRFGNGIVFTMNQNTPPEEVKQRLSESTAVLDHCIGQGGSYDQTDKLPHPFTGKEGTERRYEPINRIDLPGQRNPRASQTETSYTRAARSGEEEYGLVHDAVTGMPAAAIQFNARGDGKFSMGYVSGERNGKVDPKYHNAIRDYLNTRAAEITSNTGELHNHTDILDLKAAGTLREASRFAGYKTVAELTAAHPDLPRFVTKEDMQAIRAAKPAEVIPAATERDSLANLTTRRDDLLRMVRYLAPEAREDALSAINDLETRIVQLERNPPAAPAAQGETLESMQRTRDTLVEQWRVANREDRPELQNAINNLQDSIRAQMARENAAVAQPVAAQGETLEGMQRTYDQLVDRWQVAGDDERRALVRQLNELQGRMTNARLNEPVAAPADVAMRPWVMEEIQRVRAADGVQVGDRVETVLHRTMENHDPDRDPASFVAALVEAAGIEQNGLVEENLLSIADHVSGNLGGFEVDDTHPANYTPNSIAQTLYDMDTNPDGSVNQNGFLSTVQALETGQLDHPYLSRYPAGSAERIAASQPILEQFRNLTGQGDYLTQMIEGAITHVPRDVLTPQTYVHQLRAINSRVNDSLNSDVPEIRNLTMGYVDNLSAIMFRAAQDGSEPEGIARLAASELTRVRNEVLQGTPTNITGNAAYYNQLLDQLRTTIDNLGALGNDLGTVYRSRLQHVDGDALANMLSPEQQQSALQVATRATSLASRQGVGVEEVMGAVRSGGVANADILTRAERELAARMVDDIMTPVDPAINQSAENLVVALDENYFQDTDTPETARDRIDNFIRDLRTRGRDAYEDALGMMADDHPYSGALRDRMIHHLNELRDEYRD